MNCEALQPGHTAQPPAGTPQREFPRGPCHYRNRCRRGRKVPAQALGPRGLGRSAGRRAPRDLQEPVPPPETRRAGRAEGRGRRRSARTGTPPARPPRDQGPLRSTPAATRRPRGPRPVPTPPCPGPGAGTHRGASVSRLPVRGSSPPGGLSGRRAPSQDGRLRPEAGPEIPPPTSGRRRRSRRRRSGDSVAPPAAGESAGSRASPRSEGRPARCSPPVWSRGGALSRRAGGTRGVPKETPRSVRLPGAH
ncbi:proline-rich protein 2-like [Vulpes lagopus]|uniref:proline-rich protein 2-like n=1 Tax=Vulpes lagopus TaxID=494514 RepID=UPI001BC9D140|nr:proline-rich protein 2-like [Vulpes lagopus]